MWFTFGHSQLWWRKINNKTLLFYAPHYVSHSNLPSCIVRATNTLSYSKPLLSRLMCSHPDLGWKINTSTIYILVSFLLLPLFALLWFWPNYSQDVECMLMCCLIDEFDTGSCLCQSNQRFQLPRCYGDGIDALVSCTHFQIKAVQLSHRFGTQCWKTVFASVVNVFLH